MGRESRVKRDQPKTPKVVKPAKLRYSEHLKEIMTPLLLNIIEELERMLATWNTPQTRALQITQAEARILLNQLSEQRPVSLGNGVEAI